MYLVQIKNNGSFETNYRTSRKADADRRSKDLASSGYDGRIVTEKGHVSQTWKLQR